MINYLQAQTIIRKQARSFGTEEIELDDSLGRVLTDALVADRDYPSFNRSAVDGYAIKWIDFDLGNREYDIVETIFPGNGNLKSIHTAQCYKIMTGAAVPEQANAIFKKEDVTETDGRIKITPNTCSYFQNIAPQGQDLKAGAMALPPKFKINSAAVGLLASMGKATVRTEKQPRVALITTGDEVLPIGEPANPFQIYNSNAAVLKALLLEHGIKIHSNIHVADNKKDLALAIQKGLSADIILITGGISAGDADYVPEILKQEQVSLLFQKVAIKPGKPVLCGKAKTGTIVFALPGNPFACLVTFKLFVDFYLRACKGSMESQMAKAPIEFVRTKRTAFDEFFPVTTDGLTAVMKADGINGSGDIRLGSFSNGLAIQPATQMTLMKGDEVYYLPFN